VKWLFDPSIWEVDLGQNFIEGFSLVKSPKSSGLHPSLYPPNSKLKEYFTLPFLTILLQNIKNVKSVI
jgi:hypothetical protein